jgi:hypothetical protein
MPRYAKYQLSLEEMQKLTEGIPIRLSTFGGDKPPVFAKSLKNQNREAFEDYLLELRVGPYRLILSAAELKQVTEAA